jgi:hypothetical protein
MWLPADIKDIKEVYKFEAHNPRRLTKRYTYPVCRFCGLVFLKNKITKWSIKMGCMNELHRDYKRQFKRRTK